MFLKTEQVENLIIIIIINLPNGSWADVKKIDFQDGGSGGHF